MHAHRLQEIMYQEFLQFFAALQKRAVTTKVTTVIFWTLVTAYDSQAQLLIMINRPLYSNALK